MGNEEWLKFVAAQVTKRLRALAVGTHSFDFKDLLDGEPVDRPKAALAPYYFYAAFENVSRAIEELWISADPDEKKELAWTKEQLQNVLLAQLQPGGLFAPHEGSSYSYAPAYINPMAGLALLPLVQRCEKRRSVTGEKRDSASTAHTGVGAR